MKPHQVAKRKDIMYSNQKNWVCGKE